MRPGVTDFVHIGPAANRPGLRHVAFLLCYVRGPEGLIVELAERVRP